MERAFLVLAEAKDYLILHLPRPGEEPCSL
jgi:hypothetical protein